MSAKKGEFKPQRTAQEIRAEVRDSIVNRDNKLLLQRALKESIVSEDRRREQFLDRKAREDTHTLPLIIKKFIGTLKKAVRTTMRVKGGTPFSIIHHLFMYWDSQKTGCLSADDLEKCMNSLGVKMTEADRNEIVAHYDAGNGNGEMTYKELLKDIQRGEPTIISFVEKDNDIALRFEEVADTWAAQPDVVKHFLEAFRMYIANKMRNFGGTPAEHVQYIFQLYDTNLTGGLDAEQLVKAGSRSLKVAVTLEQARHIVKYYDRKGHGHIDMGVFLKDVLTGVQSILHFEELTSDMIEKSKKSWASNPLTVKPFVAKPNVVVQKFGKQVLRFLEQKVIHEGGNISIWLGEAFSIWDIRKLGYISRWEDMQGAASRLGVKLNREECEAIMHTYDKNGDGRMSYDLLIKDMVDGETHFTTDANHLVTLSTKFTTRAPPNVTKIIDRFKSAISIYIRKSKGSLEPRNLLHGTLLRFDASSLGRVDLSGLKGVCQELGVHAKDSDLVALINWFDTTGSSTLDINEYTRALYGEDVSTRSFMLPRLGPRDITAPRRSLSQSQILAQANSFSMLSTVTLGYGQLSNAPPLTFMSLEGPKGTEVGLDPRIQEKNMQAIERRAVKLARAQMRRSLIMDEKNKIQDKLASIEKQRKKVIEEHKKSRTGKK